MSTTVGGTSGRETLTSELCAAIYRLMVRARVLEERLIQMSKSGEAYFWIGGPGEEAFNVCLGLQVKKGEGPAYDFLHLHYRNLATLLAMGMSIDDAIRQVAMRRTDPHSMGRNFAGHFAWRRWNIVPVNSVVGTQFAMAPGTAIVQKRHGGDGVTIVVGGDAGTAEADFESCLLWSSRPGRRLPVLMIVMNNGWGISTRTADQMGLPSIAERAKPYGIPGAVCDGNDLFSSWEALREAFRWCRERRQPYLLEARVSRLYGHSSSSGGVRIADEPDCLRNTEQRLVEMKRLDASSIPRIRDEARREIEEAVQRVLAEPEPTAEDVQRRTYHPSPVDSVYPDDYTGLPQ